MELSCFFPGLIELLITKIKKPMHLSDRLLLLVINCGFKFNSLSLIEIFVFPYDLFPRRKNKTCMTHATSITYNHKNTDQNRASAFLANRG